ncbi:MAG: hypothetical protein GX339_01080 [Tissierellia bacterium]|nr:hypothetical protein [Tissierellia bacterium]
MECPFCYFLEDFTGVYLRIGVVCNCDTNDHTYRDGYITRKSFLDNTIRLFDSPYRGNVIFTADCDSIFEVYLFPSAPNTIVSEENATETIEQDAMKKDIKIPSVAQMIEERQNLLELAQSSPLEEENSHE